MTTLPPCPDCRAPAGQQHLDGCDVARCLATGGQMIQCDGLDEEPPYAVHSCGRDVWTGKWPGEAECEEFGWWAYFVPNHDPSFVPCKPGAPGATHDLNRLHIEARWDRAQARWVKRERLADLREG